jgi:DNA-binding NarL/FixJ family response regulator
MKKKKQIIIVDDNQTFLEGLATYIAKENEFEIIATFSSGIALLEKIDQYDPDLILIDIEMPKVSGFETARMLSYHGFELKLIAITMYHENIYLKQLIEAGFRGFVHKNDVLKKLNTVMERVLKDELAFPEMF